MTDISIIIPVYQAENYIEQCLSSCLWQMQTEDEIICVLDGCTDRSEEIATSYAKKDARIKTVMQDENQGPMQSRMHGIEKAGGDYFIFLDADNYLADGALAAVREAVNRNAADILQFTTMIEEEVGITKNMAEGLSRQINQGKESLDGRSILTECFVDGSYSYHLQGKCFRAELVREQLSKMTKERLDLASDQYLYFVIACEAKRYEKYNDVLSVYCFGRGITGSACMDLDELRSHTTKQRAAEQIRQFAKNYYSQNLEINLAAKCAYESLLWSSICDLKERVSVGQQDEGMRILEAFWGKKEVERAWNKTIKRHGRLDGFRAIKTVYGYLTKRQKLQMAGVFCLGIGQTFFEMLSIGAVLPYLYVWLNPQKVEQIPVVRLIYQRMGAGDEGQLLLLMTALFLLLYVLRSVYLIGSNLWIAKIFAKLEKECAGKLFDAYLSKDYTYYFSHNAAILQRNTNAIGALVFRGLIGTGLEILRLLLTGICVMGILIYADVFSAGIAIVIYAVSAFLMSVLLRRKIERNAEIQNDTAKSLHKLTMEAFRGVKQIRLFGREDELGDEYQNLRQKQIHYGIKGAFYDMIPGHIMELITVGLILFTFFLQRAKGENITDILAVMSLFGMAAIRLKPTVLGMFRAYLNLVGSMTYYDEVKDELAEVFAPTENESLQPADNSTVLAENAGKEIIHLEKICYSYPKTTKTVLKDLSFSVQEGECVGICGESGCGKSTMADLVMGFLTPDKGVVNVLGKCSTEVSHEKNRIGYVPQEIFMLDGSLAENVAFAMSPEKIDRKRVVEVLKMAQMEEYLAHLRDGIDTPIGEGGICMSGGQRQRVAIARALYNQPDILIFDEATSSLDDATEREIMETIHNLSSLSTMIIISHSEKTLKRCDKVYCLDETGLYERNKK